MLEVFEADSRASCELLLGYANSFNFLRLGIFNGRRTMACRYILPQGFTQHFRARAVLTLPHAIKLLHHGGAGVKW